MIKTIATIAAAALAIGQAPTAHADLIFDVCPSGQSGVYAGHTTCPFADSVRATYFARGGPAYMPNVYSPYTGGFYDMFCDNSYFAHLNGYSVTKLAVNCNGGTNDTAAVVFWS